MNALKWIIGIVSVLALLLGGLWFLQGTGLVTIEPIACIGECEPVEGPSTTWTAFGLMLVLAALVGIWFVTRR